MYGLFKILTGYLEARWRHQNDLKLLEQNMSTNVVSEKNSDPVATL
jgi:hypothetical protein